MSSNLFRNNIYNCKSHHMYGILLSLYFLTINVCFGPVVLRIVLVIIVKAIGSHFLHNLSTCREFSADSEDPDFVDNFIMDFEKMRAKQRAHRIGNVPKMSWLSLNDVSTLALERGYHSRSWFCFYVSVLCGTSFPVPFLSFVSLDFF